MLDLIILEFPLRWNRKPMLHFAQTLADMCCQDKTTVLPCGEYISEEEFD